MSNYGDNNGMDEEEYRHYEIWQIEYLPEFALEEDAKEKLAIWACEHLVDDPEKLAEIMGADSFGEWQEGYLSDE